MNLETKATESLGIADISEYPVWEYCNWDDNLVRPVRETPVDTLENRLVGTRVQLNDGSLRWGILSRIALNNAEATGHFMVLWIGDGTNWFELARYFDAAIDTHGPSQLAAFLGRQMGEVFPIRYDISDLAIGNPEVVKGTITDTPKERLSDDALIQLSLSLGESR